MSDEGTLRFLRELDEGTEWELPREMLDAGEQDDSMAAMPSNVYPISTLDQGETADNILSCVRDMVEQEVAADITVVVNTKDDDQYLFTTLNRNDLIIGQLEVAKMNWYNTQIYLENTEEE